MADVTNEGVQLLWTGGWDSTFQLLNLLLREGAVVTPWYVIDAERRSTGVELDTMRRLRGELARQFPEARTRLRPLMEKTWFCHAPTAGGRPASRTSPRPLSRFGAIGVVGGHSWPVVGRKWTTWP